MDSEGQEGGCEMDEKVKGEQDVRMLRMWDSVGREGGCEMGEKVKNLTQGRKGAETQRFGGKSGGSFMRRQAARV